MQVNDNNTQPPLLSDAELGVAIPALAAKSKLFPVLGVVSSVVGVILFFTFTSLLYISFLFFMATSGFFLAASFCKNDIKKLISDNIIKGVIAEKIKLSFYAPEKHIGKKLIKQAGLIPRWNVCGGSDLIKGEYRGVKFSFSDIHLEQVSGGKNKSSKTMFKGQWLILELAKEIPWEVKLREREKGDKKLKSDIETENMEFNEKFQIETTDPHTAFYVLTPHFMEYIMNADRRANSKTYINAGGRQIHIALHNGRDLFEFKLGKQKSENINILREQMRWDLNHITGVIDEFLLNERLFGGKAD